MNIALITTLPSLIENERLKQEAEKLGHQFKVISLQDFSFSIKNSRLNVRGLGGLKVDLIILRGIFVSIKMISAIVSDWQRNGVKVFDNNFLEHRYSIDKVSDMIKFAQKGVPVPNTVYTRNFDDYHRLAAKLNYPLVVKSTRMGKGTHVFKFETEKDLLEFIDECQEEGRAAKNFLLQEFIPYVYDLRVLVIGKNIFTMRRIPAEGEFRANFSLGGRVEAFKLDQESRKMALRALQASGLSIGGVDLLITKDKKRYFLEVNHTAGFVGMEKATGENIGKIWVEHAINHAK